MFMNFYSREATDLSWRAELLPTTKVSIVHNLKEGEVLCGGVVCSGRRICSVYSIGTHSCDPEEGIQEVDIGCVAS